MNLVPRILSEVRNDDRDDMFDEFVELGRWNYAESGCRR